MAPLGRGRASPQRLVGPVPRGWESRIQRLLLAAIAIAYTLHAWWLACVAEDAYITFRFARHLVRGNGLVWNAGEPPVEGYTNFLWMLLSALWIELGVDPGRAGQFAGVLAGLAAIFYTVRFAQRLFGCNGLEALLPASLLAVSGPHAAWASSGLETSAFALFVLAALYHFLVYERQGERRSLFLVLRIWTDVLIWFFHLACHAKRGLKAVCLLSFVRKRSPSPPSPRFVLLSL